jgi:uncharacterized protein with HEPN domain
MRQPDEAVLVDMLMFARRIRDRMATVSVAEFEADEDLQLAITHLIQIVGEAASRASESLRLAYPTVPWSRIVGMRHRLVHDYLRVRIDVLWRTAAEDIPPLVMILESIVPQEPEAS